MICVYSDPSLPRFHLSSGTKVMLLENFASGSIQRLTVEMLTEGNIMDCKVIHAATPDSGYGCTRRFRGWTLGMHG